MLTYENAPPIIAFGGRSGAGKDSAAQVLVAAGWVKVAFAGALKLMLHALMVSQGATFEELLEATEGADKERPSKYLGGCTPRWAMQTLGTEWGRDRIGPSFWLDVWKRQVEAVADGCQGVVVTDVRFANEADLIRSLRGNVYKIIRPSNIIGGDKIHASEKADFLAEDLHNNFDSVEAFQQAIATKFLGVPPGPELQNWIMRNAGSGVPS